jgi:hypothetical protein
MKRRANSPQPFATLLSAFTLATLLCASHLASAAAQNANVAQNTNAQNPPTQSSPAQSDAAATNDNTASATNPTPNTAATVRSAAAVPTCPTASNAQVTAVRPDGKTREVTLGDVIEVDVTGYTSLVEQAQCPPAKKNIVLYLDDRPVPGGTTYPPSDPRPSGTPEVTTLYFTLNPSYDPTTGARDVWTYLLGQPSLDEPKPVEVSIGIEDQFAVPASNNVINLKVVPMRSFLFWLLIFAVLVIGFWLLARKTDLLRDAVPPPGGGHRRPYSLARTQAAWWFFLVLASYLLIGIITGDFADTITGTALTLLGISAGTTLGSAFVDASKAQSPETQAQEANAITTLETEITQLEGDVSQLKAHVDSGAAPAPGGSDVLQLDAKADGAASPSLPALRVDLAQKQAELETKKSQLNKVCNVSENFLRDILSDVNGVSFHRFQMVAWSLVLGIIFIVDVYRVLAMPTFNSTLLALLGISAGTFVGLKIPEPTDPTGKQ